MMNILVRFAAVLLTMTAAQTWAQTFETVFSFPADGSMGTKPWATLTVGPDRNLYGTTMEGGAGGFGTAFKFTTGEAFTLLGNFEVAETGKSSKARLINLGDGFLYGATSDGIGTAGQPLGTAFKLNPAGGTLPAGGLTKIFALPGDGGTPIRPFSVASVEPNVLHVLGSDPGGIWRVPLDGGTPTPVFTFDASGDEGQFAQNIIRGSDGFLYGITTGTSATGTTPGRRGTVFRIAPNGSSFETLHDCQSETGVNPHGGLVEGEPGVFYGTTSGGGENLDGVIFKITSAGQYTVLRHMNDHPPKGDLLLASDGRLYGTSESGGANLYGSIFRINTNGTGFDVLHDFNDTDGANPKAGLVQADDGNLYGVTLAGGANDTGTIFRIDLNLPTPEANRPPIAISDFGFSSGSEVTVPVLANDFDPDEGDTLTVTLETLPDVGTATVNEDGTIRYTPTLGEYDGFDRFTYRITDSEGLFAITTLTISNDAIPPTWQPGIYNGILNLDPNLDNDRNTPRGQLIINISGTGTFTGKVFAQGKRFPVRGFFDATGTAVATVKLSRKKSAILFLASLEQGSLFAVMFGQELWTGTVFQFIAPELPVKTSFTVVVEPAAGDLPPGNGYAAMRVFPSGVVAAVGKLADGSKLAWGTTLVALGGGPGIPVYSQPVRGGVCAGTFNFTGAAPIFQASLRWIRPPAAKDTLPFPAGFAGAATGYADFYIAPPRGELPVDFGSDQIGFVNIFGPLAPLGLEAQLTVNGTRVKPDAPFRSFSFNRATGLFTGKVKLEKKTVTFRGAVLQSQQRGFGFYIADKLPGFASFRTE